MPRELSKAEQAYVTDNHGSMSAAELCADMPGVGPKTIQAFVDTSVLPEATANESPEERRDTLAKRTGLTAGKLMARDPERGITAMTAGASELSDARRVVDVPSVDKAARTKGDRIFIMDPAKKVR